MRQSMQSGLAATRQTPTFMQAQSILQKVQGTAKAVRHCLAASVKLY